MAHEVTGGSRLRVLVIAPTPFFADRGCHVRIFEQCRTLIEAGHEVVVCTYPLGRDIEGLEIRRTVPVPWYRKLSAGPSIHKFYIDLLLLSTVLRQCYRGRPDIIHAHLHEGVLIGRIASMLFRVPLVADLQGSLAAELVQHRFVRDGGWLYRQFHRLEGLLNRLPQRALVSSGQTLDSLAGLDEAARRRVVVLPDGVDRSRFYPDPDSGRSIRLRLGVTPQERVVGFLGVLTDYQGVSVLLEAARLVTERAPGVRFLIMGYPNEETYRRKAAALGIESRVKFTGRIPYDEARAYLSACDVAVSPKLSMTEANGKLLNYLAVGLPVIASDTPVNREILGTAGVLTPPGDADALACAIEALLASNEESERQRRLSESRASELCWSVQGGRLIRVYLDLLDGTSRYGHESRNAARAAW
jgi:glycosyltransferase involved in cell wall biosynthesis